MFRTPPEQRLFLCSVKISRQSQEEEDEEDEEDDEEDEEDDEASGAAWKMKTPGLFAGQRRDGRGGSARNACTFFALNFHMAPPRRVGVGPTRQTPHLARRSEMSEGQLTTDHD